MISSDILCSIPAILIIIVLFVLWLIQRSSRSHTITPRVRITRNDLVTFDAVVTRWVAEERLPPEVGATIHSLIVEDFVAAGFGAPPVAAPAPLVPAPAAPTLAPEPAPSAPPSPTPAIPQPPAPAPGKRSWAAALLALSSRRALLYLGAFLLVMSSLTLVIFNWASFSPIVQFALLAGATIAIWGTGTWMTRHPDLHNAGGNLQKIAAMLAPVVAFALSRPGLLDLALRPAWQLTSLLSLAVYLLVAWRTRHAFYSGATLVAALSLIFAAPEALSLEWQFVIACSLLTILIPLSLRMRSFSALGPATGILHVSLVAFPLLLLGHGVAYLTGWSSRFTLSLTLLLSTLFCALRFRVNQRHWWLWLAMVPPPLALVVALGADAALHMHALTLGLLALAYFWLSLVVERRLPILAMPLWSGALALGGLTLLLAPVSLETARFALGPLTALGASWFFMLERGRLVELQRYRYELATGALAGSSAACTAWIGVLLTATSLSDGQIGLALLPLAALAFIGAYWQPGRRRISYDAALQMLGFIIALIVGGLTLAESDTRLAGALMLALIFGGQAVLRRHWLWAALSLGLGLLTIGFALDQFVARDRLLRAAALAALIVSAAYTIIGERLRTTSLRSWTWPAVVWGSLSGLIAAAFGILLISFEPLLATLTILGLAGLAVLHTFLWRQALLGYVAASLMFSGALIAASQGFFTGWQPAPGDMALVVCALAPGLALIGQAFRRIDRSYALPYELTAFVVLPFAPLAAANELSRLTLAWAGMAMLYGLALWRYRLSWMLALAFVTSDLAVLQGAVWLIPDAALERGGLLLTGVVWVQALASAWLRRRTTLWRIAGLSGYVAAGLGGAGALALATVSSGILATGALALAAGSNTTLATVALALAGLLVVLAQIEKSPAAAWGSLILAVPGAWLTHTAAGLDGAWAAAWMALELCGVCLAGWGAQRLGVTLWRQVTGLGAIFAALPLVIAAFGGGFAPLTFAMANLGLLLATLAVRERSFGYAYGSGGAFVGAILSQMASWELRDLQWYVIPAGLYLLALAAGLRRFQGQHHVSRLIETAALALMPGATAAQALMPGSGLGYALLLFAESLIIAAYGALARLRTPFVGGIAFFIGAVLWMAINAAQMLNQWILLGIVGLLMVLAYVLLERYQERLMQTGRSWANQLREWE